MQSPKIIINADDFGHDAETNARIIDCFGRGLISSATVMVNMPGFFEVRDWYAAQSNKPKLGIHLNLDEGPALSEEFRNNYSTTQLFYNGNFLSCNSRYLHVIKYELRAQIERFLSSGMVLSHIDSHHHLHTHWPIAKIVVSLAQEYRIPNIRMAQNILSPSGAHKKLYRFLLNRFLFQRKLNPRVKLFSYLKVFMEKRPQISNEMIELMAHPGESSEYEMLLGQDYAKFLGNYELVSYPT